MDGRQRSLRHALRMSFKYTRIAGFSALALFVGLAALSFGRELLRNFSSAPSYPREEIETVDLALPPAPEQADRLRRVAFLDELLTRLRAIPGVIEVGGSACLPLSAEKPAGDFALANFGGQHANSSRDIGWSANLIPMGQVMYCAATPGYFRAVGIPLLRGRLFNASDTVNAPEVALISQSFARRKWPGENPLGRLIELNTRGDARWSVKIVGVVGDAASMRNHALRPTLYVSYAQRPQKLRVFTLVVRSGGEAVSHLEPWVARRQSFTSCISVSSEKSSGLVSSLQRLWQSIPSLGGAFSQRAFGALPSLWLQERLLCKCDAAIIVRLK
jgi:MacB-like periplasmic core domain